jgi:hypothetical protein
MQAPSDNTASPVILATRTAAGSSRRRRLTQILKALYILAATVLSVWTASFAPAGGPPLEPFIPANAGLALFIPSGTYLLQTVSGNRAAQDLLNDPDVNALYEPQAARERLMQKLQQAPAIVRWLFPPTLSGLSPLTGQDVAVAGAFATGPKTDDASDGGAKDRKGAPALFFTRLSGSRGQLARMALAFAPLPRNVRAFDLGGGLIAVGINGAAPGNPALALPAPRSTTPPTAEGPLLARLLIRPSQVPASHSEALAESPQYEELQNEGVPDTVLRTILQPPDAFAMLNLRAPSLAVAVDFYAAADGGLSVQGVWDGPLPPAEAVDAGTHARDGLFAESVLPIDARQCFLRYVSGEMKLRKGSTALTRGQRRWSRRFSDMDGAGVELDRDLWPVCGHTLRFSIEDDPLDPGGYGLVVASLPFDGTGAGARAALAELVRARWNGDMFEGPPPQNTKPPYVKRVPGDAFDRYLLNTGQLTVPAWTVASRIFTFLSNVGPQALRNPSLVPVPQEPERGAVPPNCYYLRVDGPRLAPTVERLATLQFDNLEDDMGSKEFLAQYPDAPVHIRLFRKLTSLAGQLRLELRPNADSKAAAIAGRWTPGTLTAPAPGAEENVPPPPPPPRVTQ